MLLPQLKKVLVIMTRSKRSIKLRFFQREASMEMMKMITMLLA